MDLIPGLRPVPGPGRPRPPWWSAPGWWLAVGALITAGVVAGTLLVTGYHFSGPHQALAAAGLPAVAAQASAGPAQASVGTIEADKSALAQLHSQQAARQATVQAAVQASQAAHRAAVHHAAQVLAAASTPPPAHPVATTPVTTPPPPPPPSSAYACPVSALGAQGRIDEGVDYAGAGPVHALGPGVVTYVSGASGWPGGLFLAYRLTAGPDAGRYVYVAEDATADVSVGQAVGTATVVASAWGGSVGIETGWAASPGTIPEAAAYYHYTDGVPTPEGYDFQAVLSRAGC